MDSPYSHTSSKEGIANERKNRVAGLHLFWQLDTVYDNDEDECHIIYIYLSIDGAVFKNIIPNDSLYLDIHNNIDIPIFNKVKLKYTTIYVYIIFKI